MEITINGITEKIPFSTLEMITSLRRRVCVLRPDSFSFSLSSRATQRNKMYDVHDLNIEYTQRNQQVLSLFEGTECKQKHLDNKQT